MAMKEMSVFLRIVLGICFSLALGWEAIALTDGEYYYSVIDDKATVGVVGSTKTATYYKLIGSVIIPDMLGGYPVVCIRDRAFVNYPDMTRIKIPNTVTNIEESAFGNCSGLKNVNVPSEIKCIGKTAFYNTALESIEVPASVVAIGEAAFGACKSLRVVTMPGRFKGGEVFKYSYQSAPSYPREVIISEGETIVVGGFLKNFSSISSIEIPDSVKTIGDDAFVGCTGIRDLTIPASVVSISKVFPSCYSVVTNVMMLSGRSVVDESMFAGCVAINEIVIPDGVTGLCANAFSGCVSLRMVAIPSSVTHIDAGAFGGCNNLKMISLPVGLKAIGKNAFKGCSVLDEINLPCSVEEIGEGAFAGCSRMVDITIPGSVSIVGEGSFMGCSSLTNVVVQNGVEMISGQAFKSCEKLTTVSLPLSVRNICDSAFQGCSDLRAIEIPYGTTEIGAYAFDGCESLESVVIPDTVMKIGAGAFRNCKKLVEINVPDSVETIGDNAFSGCVNLEHVILPNALANVGSGLFRNCTMLEAIDIPESVVSIGAYAFDGCNNLKNIVVPDCITSIRNVFPSSYAGIESIKLTHGRRSVENGMFDGCASVTNIVVPADICDIMDNAFRGCAALKEIDIPGCVTNIGKNAFSGCGVLRRVGIPASVQKIGQDAFVGCPSIRSVSMERADWGLKELFSDSVGLIEEVSVGGLCIQSSRFFDGCRSLVSVSVPDDCELYAWTFKNPKYEGSLWVENGWVLGYDGALSASVVVPASYVKIGGGAFDGEEIVEEVTFENGIEVAGGFSNCSELQRINFAGTEWRIGAYAFYNDTYLDNVVIPSSVDEIGEAAFKNCTYMQTLSMDGGVRYIGDEAFSNCASLISVEVKDGCKVIGAGAFRDCWRMLSVSLPVGIDDIGQDAFKGCSSVSGVTVPTSVKPLREIFPDRYSKITSVIISDGETEIIDGMFEGCSALTSLTIPSTVTNVGDRAFENCSSLREIGLPDSVVHIGNYAFKGCSGISSIMLPKNLESIGDEAVRSCTKITSLIVPSSVTSVGYNFVPSSLVSIYFLGNAPSYDANPFYGAHSSLTSYVIQESKGWDGVASSRVLPSKWCGRNITTWEPNQFDVVFDANGGDPATYSVLQTTDSSYSLPKVAPTRSGYVFDGWWTEQNGGAEIKSFTKVTATRSHTLYAHWTLRYDMVEIMFNANGGTVVPEKDVREVNYPYVTLPTPTRQGYRFNGWRDANNREVVAASIVTREVTVLYASWVPNVYSVVFHSNNGDDLTIGQSFDYGVRQSLRKNSFARNGYAFSGWSTSCDGVVSYLDGDVVENLTEVHGSAVHLYAVWVKTVVQYSVRFDGNGGSGKMENQSFVDGQGAALSSNAFSRTGYVFLGWSRQPNGAVEYVDGEFVASLPFGSDNTLALYAIWGVAPVEYVAKPVIDVPTSGKFSTESYVVAITCVTCNAKIYFSTNGRTPRASDANLYTKPIVISNTTTIIAFAAVDDVYSEFAEVMITKVDPVPLTLEKALDDSVIVKVTTGGDAAWVPVNDAGAKVGDSVARSGSIGEEQETWMETSFTGKGELSFWWKVNCERDPRGSYSYDHVIFEVVESGKSFKLDGVTDWTQQNVTFDDNGTHTVRWTYVSDDWSEPGYDDCAWVDGVVWVPASVPVDPIPALADDATPAQVAAALDGSADVKLKEHIVDAVTYNKYREWANIVKVSDGSFIAGGQVVRDSENAWISFALKTDRLISKALVDSDIGIEKFVQSESSGKYDFIIGLKDVEVGSDAETEHIREVLGVEGADSMVKVFSSDAVSINFSKPECGKVKFTAGAKNLTDAFFMRVRIK